jgi:uncharacterized membrane protein YgcG
MRKRIAWAVTWLAGAALAAAGAAVAISMLGTDLFGGRAAPLTPVQVAQRLAALRTATTPPGSPPPGHGTRPHPGSSPARRVTFPTPAGSVSASCSAGLATLTTWSITTPGYQADGYLQGPAPAAWIRFRSGSAEQTVTVTCASGIPHRVISTGGRGTGGTGDDHGGRRGGTGRGGDGGGSGSGGSGGHDGGGSGGSSGGKGRG